MDAPARTRAALLLLGLWLGGTVFMGFVAIQNFAVVDRLLGASTPPDFERMARELGDPAARNFLRYFSSELNRLFFQAWGGAQLVLGGLTVWAVWPLRVRWIRIGSLILLALAAILTLGLTPGIVSVGRALDFVPRDPPPPSLATFGLLHAAYTAGDAVKLLLGGAMAFRLVRGAPNEK